MRTLRILAILAFVALLAVGGWLYLGHRAEARAATAVSPSSPDANPAAATPASPAAATATAAVATATVPAVATAPGVPPASLADGAGTKPCSLVTREEMQEILGASIQRLTAAELICAYLTDETHEATIETTWNGGKQAMEDAKKFNGETMRAVPGLGDEAYFQAAGVMHVRKGDVYIIVNSRVYPNEEEAETAIVRKALARLK